MAVKVMQKPFLLQKVYKRQPEQNLKLKQQKILVGTWQKPRVSITERKGATILKTTFVYRSTCYYSYAHKPPTWQKENGNHPKYGRVTIHTPYEK
jgi:hypothetical protein